MGIHLRRLLTILIAGALLALGASATAAAHAVPHHRCQASSHVTRHTDPRAAHHTARGARRCRRPAHGTQAYRHKSHHPVKPQHHHAAAKPTAAPSSDTVNVAAVIARVLATPCENTEERPEAGNVKLLAAATLCLVNQVRARNGELPLVQNAQLEEAAVEHSGEMVSEDYFAHIAPSGETPLQRVKGTGYVPNEQVGYTVGENIAWGTLQLSTPRAIVAAWVASPEHLANILDRDYRDTGMGIAPAAPPSLAQGSPGGVYSQEFGVIVG